MKKTASPTPPAYDSPLVRRLMGRKGGKRPKAMYMVRGEKYGKGVC